MSQFGWLVVGGGLLFAIALMFALVWGVLSFWSVPPADGPVPHEGASEGYAAELHEIAEEIADVPAVDDPALNVAEPLADEPVGPPRPPWHEMPAATGEIPALYHQIGPSPVLGLTPEDLSHTHAWNRDGLLARIRAHEEANR